MKPLPKTPFLSNVVKMRLIGLFIALSLSVTWFYMIRPLAFGVPGNSTNVYVFSADSHTAYHLPVLENVWRPRIGGLWLSGRLFDLCVKDGKLNGIAYQNIFAFYHAAWLGLLFVAILIFAPEPIFALLGCFAGLFYMLTPTSMGYSYPWDFPALFFFGLSFFLWMRGHYAWMLPVIILGTLFKETPAVTAILFFFTGLTLRRKWTLFGIAFVACLIVKILVGYAVDGKFEIFTQQYAAGEPNWLLNCTYFLHPPVNNVIFVNAGTFVVSFFLPMRTRFERGTKCLLLIFLAGQFIAGGWGEVREMLEAIPVSVLYLQNYIATASVAPVSIAPASTKAAKTPGPKINPKQ